ncbi:MAG: acyl-CoA dehydrogenase [bacterium]
MSTLTLTILSILLGSLASFKRWTLQQWTITTALLLGIGTITATAPSTGLIILWLVFIAVALPLNHSKFRRNYITEPAMMFYRKITPTLSDTEKTALEAGTVGWEGELFSGKPNWKELRSQPIPELSAEERAFLDGPVEELCAMVNDWEIAHEHADLTPEIWEYVKSKGFFAMIIPKKYGGLEFSALAHSAVLQKLITVSTTLASNVAVPNSLGPAELLHKYGTEEQKNHYLPRLAKGQEVPCFALTGPTAGSDATSIPDVGVVCEKLIKGKKVLGLSLTFDKRYITLAPVASLIGLAFQMRDPEHLLGDEKELGITLCLMPRETQGLEIGNRHMPLNVPFQNGPVRGKDVFLPLEQIIGGPEMAGHGWQMLVECLSVGRAISLPSNACGGMRLGAITTGAYARIRKQFNLPIGRFEGVEEAMARIGGFTYAGTALARMTAAAVDRGEKPAVPSAIAKYHATELGRQVASDAMDVHGGKGIILGPRNYLGRAWQGAPISITVEGANILTRSLMIYGQGAIRCHPWVLKEMEAALDPDYKRGLKNFDEALFGHIGYAISNAIRSFVLGLSNGWLATTPGSKKTRRYYKYMSRYSAALAYASDMAMLVLGGKLKRKEKLSARLGDILSQLYILSSMIKRFEDQGEPSVDMPLLQWAAEDSVFKMQTAMSEFLRNFPVRPVAVIMRAFLFPFGLRAQKPSDRLGHKVASLLMSENEARARLAEGMYLTPSVHNVPGHLEVTFRKVIKTDPIERRIYKAIKAGMIKADSPEQQLVQGIENNVINKEEAQLLREVRAEVSELIAVDDFDPAVLAANQYKPSSKQEKAA